MATITEIAPSVYRISVLYPAINLQFNHFLVRDEEPLLFHAGLRGMFLEVRDAMTRIMDPEKLRWVSWSHFEAVECGALNDWLAVAPKAKAACGALGAMVSVNDFCGREVRQLTPDEVLTTGKYRFRFYPTPQLPHGWDAGVLFEEKERTLFCSDLFHQFGDVEPMTQNSVIDRCGQALKMVQAGPLANYIPYTHNTAPILEGLASLAPKTLAVQHGSCFKGDCRQALLDLNALMKELLDRPTYTFPQPAPEAIAPASVPEPKSFARRLS